jgi:hypothetical protein
MQRKYETTPPHTSNLTNLSPTNQEEGRERESLPLEICDTLHDNGIHTYIYIYIERERERERECVCLCVWMRERERERERKTCDTLHHNAIYIYIYIYII